jgi:hypothetical protein
MSQGKHNHFPQVKIDDTIKGLDTKWSKLIERVKNITKQAAQKYKAFEPLIKYFEFEML